MQTLCAEFSRRTKLPVNFEADPNLQLLPDIHQITLYRVLQEALTNIVKHAEAAQVWVDLTVEDRIINLTIQDDGHGFNVEKTRSAGIGLTGLRERVTLAGGKFNVSSSPIRGTILLTQFPISEDSAEKRAT
jgi:signal transduction histidine kinase